MDAKTVGIVADLTAAGYRGYTDADVERLHLVLVYRAVGLPLDEIRTLLDDPSVDVLAHLQRQHGLLLERSERRWGDTDAWKQSRQRVSRMTKQDWIDVKAEGDALLADLAQAKRDGVLPGSSAADDLVARHRASIERFYEFGSDMHRGLVEMYVADERFTRYYDDVEPGSAQFVRDIVVASIES